MTDTNSERIERIQILDQYMGKIALLESDYDWLIEQAEQVSIAKEDVRVIELKIGELYAENKRFREAIKETIGNLDDLERYGNDCCVHSLRHLIDLVKGEDS